MANAEAALSEVLAWVRDVTPDSPALRPIAGISDSELGQLARLGALLRARLVGDAPAALVAALTPDGAVHAPDAVLTALDTLIAEDAVVHLADLYAAMVSPAKRRPLGTFFTPREYAQAIVDGFATRHEAPSVVVDVGAGVGIFSEIARAKWPAACIQAIDINPLTLGLQAVAAAKFPAWNVELLLADYRRWLDSNQPSAPTLYLGNPPYTRWQLLDPVVRLDLLQAAGGLVGARANLSTLFLAMTLAKLRAEDSLAMIIPAGWMRADYGRKLRGRLRALTERQVSLRLADSWRFHEAIVDAVLVEVGPEVSTAQPIEVSDWSGSERLTLSRAEGEAAFAAPGRARLTAARHQGQGRAFGDFGRVTRGTATGANQFFVKTTTAWDELHISAAFRRPLARRLRPGTDSTLPTLETAELLVLEGYDRGSDDCVDAWINAGEDEGLSELHLCSKRARWFDLSAELKIPDVIISALARDVFHVLENPTGLAITNNLFGLYWTADATTEARTTLLDWLRSTEGQATLRSSASVEANGLHRLSPKTIGELRTNLPTESTTPVRIGLTGLVVGGGRSK